MLHHGPVPLYPPPREAHCHGRQRVHKDLEVSALRGVQTRLKSAASGDGRLSSYEPGILSRVMPGEQWIAAQYVL